MRRLAPRSKQRAKFFDGESGVAGNAPHRECVDRIVARDRHDPGAVRHDDMLALTRDAEARFFQGSHGFEVIDAGDFRQA
jgi:hypothetical protein